MAYHLPEVYPLIYGKVYDAPCDGHPCQHGGQCSVVEKKFHCDCPIGYTGITCEFGKDIYQLSIIDVQFNNPSLYIMWD